MSAALYRAPADAYARPSGDAYARDPVVVAARALRAAADERGEVTERIHGDAERLRTRLDRVAHRRALARSVLVADDSPAALAGLAIALRGVAPLHLVTDARTAVDGLAALEGVAEVHHVADFDAVAGLVRRHHCAVVVVDVHLGDRNGAEIVERFERGPRVLFVTSHDAARDSLADVARLTQSEALIRTDSGGWVDVLRERVERALREACG